MFNLIHTSSRPKYTVRTTMTSWTARSSICRTGFKPQGWLDFLVALPMISRGFWLFERTESRYKGCRYPEPWTVTAALQVLERREVSPPCAWVPA